MKVGWLVDDPGYIGGAELTQAEFRAAAPEGIEVVDCPPGDVVSDLALYVLHNHMNYSEDDLRLTGPRVRYHHDMRPQKVQNARHIFCSPLQRERLGMEGECIPPPVHLERFREAGKASNGRSGVVWLGIHADHPDKGLDLALEWADGNGGLEWWDDVSYEDVPELLARYRTFVHLPRAMEPFGRSVVEAWASGCDLVVNKLVGALHWIQEQPEKLETAAEDFWDAVLD